MLRVKERQHKMNINRFIHIDYLFSKHALVLRCLLCVSIIVALFFSQSIFFQGLVAVILMIFILFGTSISLEGFVKMVFLPLGFIVSGSATIALSFGADTCDVELFTYYGTVCGFSFEGLYRALNIAAKSMSLIVAFYTMFIIITFSEMIYALKRAGVGAEFLEHIQLTFIFIQNIINQGAMRIQAQKCRLAYTGRKLHLKSRSYVLSSVFQASLIDAQLYVHALESRNNGQALSAYIQHKELKISHVVYISLLVMAIGTLYYLIEIKDLANYITVEMI